MIDSSAIALAVAAGLLTIIPGDNTMRVQRNSMTGDRPFRPLREGFLSSVFNPKVEPEAFRCTTGQIVYIAVDIKSRG